MSRSGSGSGRWKDRLGKGRLVLGGEDLFMRASAAPMTAFHRRVARVLLALVIVVILFCGYFPFDFIFYDIFSRIHQRFDWSLAQYRMAGDTIENLLFFMPLGFVLGALFRRKRLNWVGNALVVAAISFFTSCMIEVGQVFVWSRDPSVTDILNNTIGGVIGWGVYRLVDRRLLDLLNRSAGSKSRKYLFPVMLAAAALLAAVICLAPMEYGKNAGELSTWSSSYEIAMGNEINAARGWPGFVERAVVASKAADDTQAAALLEGHKPTTTVFDAASLQASYDLHGEPPFLDATGKSPALVIDSSNVKKKKGAPTSAPGEMSASNPAAAPVEVSEDRFLRTIKPVEALNRAIVASNEFSVLVTASPSRQDPVGQARIFTISNGPYSRNLMLAQDGRYLLIRLRTGASGANGDRPQFIVLNTFDDNRTRNILVTFKNSVLTVYVDNSSQRYATRFTPEAATIFNAYPRSNGWSFYLDAEDVNKQSIVYRVFSFFLLSLLITIAFNVPTAMSRKARAVAIITGLLISMAALEFLMIFVAKQPMHLRGMACGVFAAVVGTLMVGVDQRDELIRMPKAKA